MPRSISSALSTELAKTITSVGYLVHITTTTPQRWSNIGQVSWNSQTWADVDFSIDGLQFDIDAALSARLSIQNLDGTAGTLFLADSETISTLTVTVYQFEREALAVADVPKIAVLAIADCEVTPTRVVLQLVEQKSEAAYAPRRRINPTNGFYFATPPGSTIVWGNEILTLEASDG